MVIAIGDINEQWRPVAADKPSDLESHFLINKVAPIFALPGYSAASRGVCWWEILHIVIRRVYRYHV